MKGELTVVQYQLVVEKRVDYYNSIPSIEQVWYGTVIVLTIAMY